MDMAEDEMKKPMDGLFCTVFVSCADIVEAMNKLAVTYSVMN